MADVQIPVEAGILPQGFCPTTPQAMLDGFAEVMTVTLPAVNSTVKISTAVINADIGKLWVKVDADGNPLGTFIYDAAAGDWVRATPYTNMVPEGTIWDWFFVGTEMAAKAAAALLGQADEPNPNALNPYWRLCDGMDGTPDLRSRVLVGAGDNGVLTPRNNADIFGDETVALVVTEIPKHTHIVGTDDGTANNSPNRLAVTGAITAMDGTATTSGLTTTETGGDPADSYNTKPHANIQPSFAVWKIIKTGRKF